MGGQKKRPLARDDKSQASRGDKEETKRTAMRIQPKALLLPKFDDPEVSKVFKGMKAITLYRTARAFGVNASIAAYLLKTLESKAIIKKRVGFSGHYIWSMV